jgi:dihydroorotase
MLLSNPLFEIDTLLNELQKESKPGISALEILQRKLKTHYFNQKMSDEDILEALNKPAFDEFPRFKYVLQQIFSGQSKIVIPKDLKDWEPQVLFQTLNATYGYFDSDLSDLFNRLAIPCRKMTSLIEGQAYDDAMAYKLMALFYDPKKNLDENFKLISQKFDTLITTKQDKMITSPYHDTFLTTLIHFPKREDVQDFDGWKSFIMNQGLKGLDFFAKYAQIRPAFKSLQEAQEYLITQAYPRAHDNLTLAKLCKSMLISNYGFEAGLEEVKSGWPKKRTDNLPIVDISDETNQYFWVKLPPEDMRAMYLGNMIPGCCQFINGDSQKCVKDGIRLSDNGFYVLLKFKNPPSGAPRIDNHEINLKNYEIVAQSYAWKSKNGNLCLDSIEWNRERVTTQTIQELMSKFSAKIFEEHPSIKHITIGQGGQTPQEIYPTCTIFETMKQGYMYGDARAQYQIASQISQANLEKLKERFNELPEKAQKTLLYLAPYFEDIEKLPSELMSVIDELPQLISKINLPPKLSTSDLKKISFEEYQDMSESEQSSVSTVCKIFNSQNEHELKKWLPTIPDEELWYISLMQADYSIEFKVQILQKLPREHQLQTLHELDTSNKSLLCQSLKHPELFKMILSLYPTKESCIAALKGNDVKEDGDSIFITAISNPKYIKIILELFPEDQRLGIVKDTKIYASSILRIAAFDPESLKMILSLYPTDEARLDALKKEDTNGGSALKAAAFDPESLKIVLSLYPTNEARLNAVKTVIYSPVGLIIALSDPKYSKMILELFPENERLDVVKKKNALGKTILMSAASNPENLRGILEALPTDQRLEALQEKDIQGKSILMNATSNPKYLKVILEALSVEQRLDVLKEKDKYRKSILTDTASNPESLRIILEAMSVEQRLDVLKEKDKYGNSIFKYAVSNPESLKMILEAMSVEQRLDILKEKDENGELILMHAVSNPESLRIILALYPADEARLEALQEKDENGKSILMHAVSNPESLRIILALYPTDEARLEALQEKDENGDSILMHAASNPESLRMILELTPEEKRLEALKEKDSDGRLILWRIIIYRTQSLKVILELIPEEKRIEALKEKDDLGKSAFLELYHLIDRNPQSIDAILEVFPADIALVIESCMKNLGRREFEELTLSMIGFMNNMKGLATPEAINDFVTAVMNNQDIEKALNALLTPPSSFSFFKTNSKEAIQQCINQLDNHWLSRIQAQVVQNHQPKI